MRTLVNLLGIVFTGAVWLWLLDQPPDQTLSLVVAVGGVVGILPLVWLGRRRGFALKRRVYGPELMQAFCAATGAKYRHFFCGGAPGVSERLANTLQRRHGIVVAGTFSPPFRPLSNEEEAAMVGLVRAASPDVLWVGLGTPKQERWMHAHRNSLEVPVMVGVGAAFDLCSGNLRQAPRWMRENGLEWLFRLFQEPRRLGRRYLVYGAEFLVQLTLRRVDGD